MTSDFIVVGAGIAGVSAAYELSALGKVTVLEQERVPGYHTTGRSAAISSLNFISPTTQALTIVSREFLSNPPQCFGTHPLTTLRQSLWVTQPHQADAHNAMRLEALERNYRVRELTADQVVSLCPVLRRDKVAMGLLEEDTLDLDVHGMMQGYIRGLRARGGIIEANTEVERIEWDGSLWLVRSGERVFSAPVLINAAGAWGDTIALKAGVKPLNIRPLRRTVFTFEAPEGAAPNSWPFVYDTAEQFYFKLENGIILASAFDEIESPPCDAWPDDYDIAAAIDRILSVTTLDIRSLKNRWAGLRTFAPDRELVIGLTNDHPGFYWLTGHGGIGLMTAPAVAQALAGIIASGALPKQLADLNLTEVALAASRFEPGVVAGAAT
jgi:D-arginine dehydrogenase